MFSRLVMIFQTHVPRRWVGEDKEDGPGETCAVLHFILFTTITGSDRTL